MNHDYSHHARQVLAIENNRERVRRGLADNPRVDRDHELLRQAGISRSILGRWWQRWRSRRTNRDEVTLL